jgi:hypothetical protein
VNLVVKGSLGANAIKRRKMKLVKYRDAGMNTYTYFWTRDTGGTVSPFFDTEKEAHDWLDLEKYKLEARGLWSDSCTTQRIGDSE